MPWKPTPSSARPYASFAGGDLGVRGEHVHAAVGEVDRERGERLADPHAVGVGRPWRAVDDRAARHVRRAAADPVPRPHEDEGPGVADDVEPRLPARRLAMRGPRPRLQDVAALDVDRARVPVVELVGGQLPDAVTRRPRRRPRPPRTPRPTTPPLRPWRSRSTRTRAAWATAYVRRPSGSSTRSYAPM